MASVGVASISSGDVASLTTIINGLTCDGIPLVPSVSSPCPCTLCVSLLLNRGAIKASTWKVAHKYMQPRNPPAPITLFPQDSQG